MSMLREWLDHFAAFSSLHLATLLFFAALWAALIRYGIARRNVPGAPQWRRHLGQLCLAIVLLGNGVQLCPPWFDAAETLPLQICDITEMLVPFALWFRHRVLYALLYFWGLGFSVQAILTPDLAAGPLHLAYWTFWLPHAMLTGSAVFVLIVDEFRPGWHDYGWAYGLAVVYLVLILPFDLLTGFNYGYVGPGLPGHPSLLDLLGPWPWRIGAMMLTTAMVFALMQLPWTLRAQKPRSRA